ncbi:hypothetical protein [Ramlibacter sp.]|uniref:hypothetical protein n=1 Tax=Ramlibacter sp. TaxID=1917967 RepID=UPI002FC9EC17
MKPEPNERMGTADLVAGAEPQDPRPWQERQPPATMQQGRDVQAQHLGGGVMPQQMEQRQPMDQPPPQHGEPQHGAAVPRDPHAPGQPPAHGMEQLAALFPPGVAADFRHRWDEVQIGFVDDPRQAVQHADELVAQVMKSLAASFAGQRAQLEASLGRGEQADTEDLRVALRGYRSFFQRLLSL